jgi:membrane associated rhomboid family serine protease
VKRFWRQFQASLKPGVRVLLGVLTSVYLAAVIGRLARAFDLNAVLSLNGPQFRGGQIWRIATYPLVPSGLMNFIMNGLALLILGGLIERVRTRWELWLICAVSTVGAGLAKVLLQSSGFVSLAGLGPVVFGLLAAWCFHCGHEKVSIFPFGEVTVRQLAFLAGTASLLATAFSAGWSTAVILLAGGLSGWVYVWLNHKRLMSRESRVVRSGRINRLEL